MSSSSTVSSKADQALYDQPQTINLLPRDLKKLIMSHLPAHQLASLTKVCREWKELSSNFCLWTTFVTQLGLTPAISTKEAYSFGLLMYSDLNLKQRLGDKICTTIEQMPVWKPEIQFEANVDTNPLVKDVKWSQFPFMFDTHDHENHFFKKIVGQDLYLILVPKNRFKSVVFRLYCRTPTLETKQYIYHETKIDYSTYFYLNVQQSPEANASELATAWTNLQLNLNEILELNTQE